MAMNQRKTGALRKRDVGSGKIASLSVHVRRVIRKIDVF